MSITLPKFSIPTPSIYTEMKERVSVYFKEKNISPTGNYKLFIKAFFWISLFISTYISLVFFDFSLWISVVLCVILALAISAIGFNIMHDGAHDSFSKYKWLNSICAYSLSFLGGNTFMWKMKHNVIHHAYTNVDGIDDDIDAKPFLRLCNTQKYKKIHRFQHFYFFIAYSWLYIYWVLVTDFKKYFLRRVGSVPLKKMKLSDHILFWGFKIIYVILFVVLPIYTQGVQRWLIGFFIVGLTAGLVLSIVFQLAHTLEETTFPQPVMPQNKLEDEWALHQLKTTANFATKSKLTFFFVGGLNFQVEHHLFPKISHIHYPAISKIIKEVCDKYKVPYLENKNVYQALVSHILFLKSLSVA